MAFKLGCLAGCTLLACGRPVEAQVTWINAGAGSWFTGANWSSGITPGTQDAALVGNGGSAQAGGGTVAVNRLEVGRNAGSGAFTASGAGVLVDSDFDVGEVTGDFATGSANIANTGTVLIEDSASLEVGVNNLAGDFDIGQTGATLGGSATSMATAMIRRHGDITIATNLEVAPASADASSASRANGQLTIDTADSVSVAGEMNIGAVNGAGTAESTAAASLLNVALVTIGGAANVGIAKGTSISGNSASGTLVFDHSTVEIGFANPLVLEDLNIGDVSTAGAGVLHGHGVVSVNSSQLTVGNRIDVARLTGGGPASTAFGRLEAVGSHVIADDLTVAETTAGLAGVATGDVSLASTLVELGTSLRLSSGATLEFALSGAARADGAGGAQYAAIDAAMADLAGTLRVTLGDGFTPSAGQSFLLVASPLINGDFSSLDLPDLPGGTLDWSTSVDAGGYRLSVVSVGLAGDYNNDGAVDAADYTVWRNSLGSSGNLAADGNGNSLIDSGDYLVWRNNYGASSAQSVDINLTTAPEPTGLAICVALGSVLLASHRLCLGVRS